MRSVASRVKRLTSAEDIIGALKDCEAADQVLDALRRRVGEMIRVACFERDINMAQMPEVGAGSNIAGIISGRTFSEPIVLRFVDYLKKCDAE